MLLHVFWHRKEKKGMRHEVKIWLKDPANIFPVATILLAALYLFIGTDVARFVVSFNVVIKVFFFCIGIFAANNFCREYDFGTIRLRRMFYTEGLLFRFRCFFIGTFLVFATILLFFPVAKFLKAEGGAEIIALVFAYEILIVGTANIIGEWTRNGISSVSVMAVFILAGCYMLPGARCIPTMKEAVVRVIMGETLWTEERNVAGLSLGVVFFAFVSRMIASHRYSNGETFRRR